MTEIALTHTIENKVKRAYRRGDLFDMRRRLIDDWGAYCASDGAAGVSITLLGAPRLADLFRMPAGAAGIMSLTGGRVRVTT